MKGFSFELASVCSFCLSLQDRVFIGDTAEGLRLVGFLSEGTVAGPRLSGRVLPGAADWAVIRRDGVLRPEVHLAIRTDDGAMIQMSYDGFLDMGPDSYEQIKRGERTGRVFHPRTAVRMITASPEYAWVNRRQFIGVGLLDYGRGAGEICYDIYEITAPG